MAHAMETLWYALLALMLTTWLVLDGFDLGCGVVHLFVARAEDERRHVLAAIGPVWDGNEVWLVASGGVLVFAFPRAYAAAFSGFYLPLMIVLWLLVVRGLSIEVRGQWPNPLWRAFFDVSFAGASTLLAFVLGVALGNLVRGVPVGRDGSFAAPLFGGDGRVGAIDGYTALVGLFAVAALGAHGAAWLAHKCEGELQARAHRALGWLWPATLALTVVVSAATLWQTPLGRQLALRPLLLPLPLGALAALAVAWRAGRRGRDGLAFAASSTFLVALMLATAGALFPVILRSTVDRAYDVTAYDAATSPQALAAGLAWWIPALLLALGYFTYLFRSFAGKVTRASHHD